MNIFNSPYEEIGDLKKNLVLNTSGKVKIRFGKKFIDVLDNNGNLNVTIPKVILYVENLDSIKLDGLYVYNNDLYISLNGETILLTGIDGEYIKYSESLNLSENEIRTTQNNIGLTYNSLLEASANGRIVFIGDKIYYVNGKIKTLLTLDYPLSEINSSNLSTPSDNVIIGYKNGYWLYLSLDSDGNLLLKLNEPLSSINSTNMGHASDTNILLIVTEDNIDYLINNGFIISGEEFTVNGVNIISDSEYLLPSNYFLQTLPHDINDGDVTVKKLKYESDDISEDLVNVGDIIKIEVSNLTNTSKYKVFINGTESLITEPTYTKAILFKDGIWQYGSVGDKLNRPLSIINESGLNPVPTLEELPDGTLLPTGIVYSNGEWKYSSIISYSLIEQLISNLQNTITELLDKVDELDERVSALEG